MTPEGIEPKDQKKACGERIGPCGVPWAKMATVPHRVCTATCMLFKIPFGFPRSQNFKIWAPNMKRACLSLFIKTYLFLVKIQNWNTFPTTSVHPCCNNIIIRKSGSAVHKASFSGLKKMYHIEQTWLHISNVFCIQISSYIGALRRSFWAGMHRRHANKG